MSVHWHSVVFLQYGTGTFGYALHLAEHLLVVCGSSYVVHAVLEWIVSWYYADGFNSLAWNGLSLGTTADGFNSL